VGAFDETVSEGIGFFGLIRTKGAKHMKIAISDVAHDCCRKAEAVEVGARRDDALGKP
jgi:hypothetical protein